MANITEEGREAGTIDHTAWETTLHVPESLPDSPKGDRVEKSPEPKQRSNKGGNKAESLA